MSNTVRNIEISKAEEVGAAIIDEQPQDYSIVQEWADKLGIELPQESAHVTPIKELSALVKGLVRKVLNMFLPQIVNKTEETYSHLDSRCTAYTPAAYAPFRILPYDPMTTPRAPRTLPNLLTALTAFSARKISNGSAPNDGIPDGVSLAHLLCSANGVTKLVDDNSGWVCDKAIPANIFPNLVDATLRMKSITAANALNNLGASGKVTMPELETITSGASQYNDPMPLNATEIIADDVTASDAIFSQKSYPNLQKVSMKKVRSLNGRSFYDLQAEGPLKEVYLPELRTYDTWAFLLDYSGTRDKYLSLILLEIGSDVSCNISNWNPTNALSSSASDLVADPTAHPTWKNLDQFLQNFKDHICQRLADRTGQSKLTLTLSAGVYTAIMTDDDIKAELVARNWKVTDGTNNYNN